MTTAPFTYVEIAAVDDLEFFPPCNNFTADDVQCELPGEWIVVKSCCGSDATLCDVHIHSEVPVACGGCGTKFTNGRDMIKNAMRIK